MSDVINKIKEYRSTRSPYWTVTSDSRQNVPPVKPNPMIYQTFEDRIKMVSDRDPFSVRKSLAKLQITNNDYLVEEAVKKASDKSASKRYRYDSDDNPSQYSSREFNEFADYEKMLMITPRYISDWKLNEEEDVSSEINIAPNNSEGKEDSNTQKYDDYIQKLSTIKETESLETKQMEDTVNFGLLNKDSQSLSNYFDKEHRWSKKKIILTSFLTEESDSDLLYKRSDSNRDSRSVNTSQESNLMVGLD